MTQGMPLPHQPHPDEREHEVNPHFLAEINYDLERPHAERLLLTAYEIKTLHGRLPAFSNEELKQILILPVGSRLKQGATYLDLNDPQRRVFTATVGMEAGPNSLYVPKREVPYLLWDRLLGKHHADQFWIRLTGGYSQEASEASPPPES
jgi:hypothetical protein